jgi:multiple sugar transport system permease protein
MSNHVKGNTSEDLRNRVSLTASRVAVYVVLIFITLLCVVPIWLMFVNATRNTAQINEGVSLIPGAYLGKNLQFLLDKDLDIGRGLLNSAVISVGTTALSVYFALMTAYAIEVYDFKLKEFMKGFVYILVLIPTQTSIIGFYQYIARLDLLNNYIPLILPGIAAAGSVFFAKQYLESALIMDLIYTARIDGCGEFGIFHRIMMPIAKPGMFTMAIFAFVASWNNFFTPTMLITDKNLYTLPLMVGTLQGDTYRQELGAIYFGYAMTVFPVIVGYILMAKQIVNGLALGSVKE